MSGLSKFWSLNLSEKKLLFEAFILLFISHLSVKTVAFRHIYSFLRGHWNNPPQQLSQRPDCIRAIHRSLSRVENRSPWTSLCLSRSSAAFIMLSRRGIPAVIVAGVRFEEPLLRAHAWVHAGLGAEKASENEAFTTIMRIGKAPVNH